MIRHLDPDKWKIMRVLPVYGDRDAVTLDEFRAFLDRHQEFASIIVSEDNEDMIASYLMVDPLGRFFWRVRVDGEGYEFSDPILRVGATAALQQCPIAWEKYEKRYDRLAI